MTIESTTGSKILHFDNKDLLLVMIAKIGWNILERVKKENNMLLKTKYFR